MIPVSERTSRFMDIARSAIEAGDGAEALDTICRAYRADIDSFAAMLSGTETDLKQVSARLRTSDDVARTLHTVVSAEVGRNARIHAYNLSLMRTITAVRNLARRAQKAGELVSADDVAAVLDEPVDEPSFAPVVVAFTSDARMDRAGQFESVDGVIVAAYPMVGWSLVVRQSEDAEPRRLEPTFMVEDRALPESFLRQTYGLRLKRLL